MGFRFAALVLRCSIFTGLFRQLLHEELKWCGHAVRDHLHATSVPHMRDDEEVLIHDFWHVQGRGVIRKVTMKPISHPGFSQGPVLGAEAREFLNQPKLRDRVKDWKKTKGEKTND